MSNVKKNIVMGNKLKTFHNRKSKLNKNLNVPSKAHTIRKKTPKPNHLPVIKEKPMQKRFKSPCVMQINQLELKTPNSMRKQGKKI